MTPKPRNSSCFCRPSSDPSTGLSSTGLSARRPLRLACLAGLLAFFAGCASQPPTEPDQSSESINLPGASDLQPLITNEGDIIHAKRAAEPFDVTDDAVFQLLVAEFAGQRGRLDLAVDKYLAAAKSLNNAEVAERAARIAVFARKYDSAIEAAKIWAIASPLASEPRQILAAMYIRTGNAEAAQRELEQVLNGTADEQGTRLRMIVNLLGREQDRQTALAVMEKLLENRGDHVEANVAYALLAIRAEKPDVAKLAINRVTNLGALDANLAVAYISLLQKT